jgi:hypothetical protein
MKTSSKVEKAYQVYINGYTGSKVVSKYSLDETGQWQVYGEDPNCDMGGYHHEPFLGTYEGKLRDVIYYALTLNGFVQWGGGGKIEKLDINGQYEELVAKREEVWKQLLAIDSEIQKLL